MRISTNGDVQQLQYILCAHIVSIETTWVQKFGKKPTQMRHVAFLNMKCTLNDYSWCEQFLLKYKNLRSWPCVLSFPSKMRKNISNTKHNHRKQKRKKKTRTDIFGSIGQIVCSSVNHRRLDHRNHLQRIEPVMETL